MAHAHRLTNVLMVVDRNGFQANGRTEEIAPLEPLGAKLEAFGCGVARVDGHDLDALDGALARFPWAERGPSVLVADTVRGKGLPSLEARADRWFCDFSAGEVEMLIEELHGTSEAHLTTAGRTVR